MDVPEQDMLMPEWARNKGIVYLGSNERLRAKLDKLKRGQNITVAAVGGSITAGQNVLDSFFDIWVSARASCAPAAGRWELHCTGCRPGPRPRPAALERV